MSFITSREVITDGAKRFLCEVTERHIPSGVTVVTSSRSEDKQSGYEAQNHTCKRWTIEFSKQINKASPRGLMWRQRNIF